MNTFLSHYYDALEEVLNYFNIVKFNSYPEYNVTYFCAEILVYTERLESAGSFEPKHLGYTTYLFEDNSDSRLFLW